MKTLKTVLVVLATLWAITGQAAEVITDVGEWPAERSYAHEWNQPFKLNFKVGGWPTQSTAKDVGVIRGFIASLQHEDCGGHCAVPFITTVNNGFTQNTGIGIDYVFKPVHTARHAVEFAVGVVQFADPMNNSERSNFHLGATFKIHTSKSLSVQLSVDHFSNGRTVFNRSEVERNVPVNMIMMGVAF